MLFAVKYTMPAYNMQAYLKKRLFRGINYLKLRKCYLKLRITSNIVGRLEFDF